jgi:hypothetical protein
VFNILKNDSDPYKKFKEIAKAANAGRVKLAQPWETLRMLIMPKPSEEKRLMMGKAYSELDEGKKKALFYAVFALEEAFGVYRSALREYMEVLKKVMQRGEVGEGPFKKVVYVADLRQIKRFSRERGNRLRKSLESPQGEAERMRSQVWSGGPLKRRGRCGEGAGGDGGAGAL